MVIHVIKAVLKKELPGMSTKDRARLAEEISIALETDYLFVPMDNHLALTLSVEIAQLRRNR